MDQDTDQRTITQENNLSQMEQTLNALLADLQTNLNKVSPHPASSLHHTTTQNPEYHPSLVATVQTTQKSYSPPVNMGRSEDLSTKAVQIDQRQQQEHHFYTNIDNRLSHPDQHPYQNEDSQKIQNGFQSRVKPPVAQVGSSHERNQSSLQTSTVHPTYENSIPLRDKMYRHETREEVRTETRSSGPNPTPQRSTISNNLSELDSLLHDLNTTKHNSIVKESKVVNGNRPSVDSLLDELNSVGHRTDTTEKRTTVQESRTTHTPSSSTYPHKVSHVSASNATKELDDLMESLSDFKPPDSLVEDSFTRPESGGPVKRNDAEYRWVTDQVKHEIREVVERPSPPPQVEPKVKVNRINASSLQSQVDNAYAKPLPKRLSPPPPPKPQPKPAPTPNQLDSMLGSLTSHMTEQGINTSQKGCCCACDKPIVGQVITALGKTWHPEHFVCAHCKEELGTKNFFERDGKPYCEPDYHNLFSPKCAYCSGPILDKCVTAMNKTWHPEHFFCAQCGNTFGEEGFHEKNGKPYCKDDYFNMFAPKCGGCNNPIMENYISALNSQWHPECFVCRDCNQPFNGGSFFDHEGHPYCETHYHAKRGSLCAACNKPITGRCITAMFRKYHPEHFLCAFCLQQLNKGTFKEQNNKPYCHTCFDKLYG